MADDNLIPGLVSPYATGGAAQAAQGIAQPAGGTVDFSGLMTGAIPMYNNAISGIASPGATVGSQLGWDQITGAFNAAGNQRATQGLMGGTEAENLTARMGSQLAQQQTPYALNLMGQQNSLLGLGMQNDQNTMSALLQLLRAGYTG